MIGEELLSWLKKTAYFVNIARGDIVDMQSLVDTLRKGRIAGAAIDVFDIEPPFPEWYPYLQVPNMILMPHIGYSTVESMEKRTEIVFDNLYVCLDGKAINQVTEWKESLFESGMFVRVIEK